MGTPAIHPRLAYRKLFQKLGSNVSLYQAFFFSLPQNQHEASSSRNETKPGIGQLFSMLRIATMTAGSLSVLALFSSVTADGTTNLLTGAKVKPLLSASRDRSDVIHRFISRVFGNNYFHTAVLPRHIGPGDGTISRSSGLPA